MHQHSSEKSADLLRVGLANFYFGFQKFEKVYKKILPDFFKIISGKIFLKIFHQTKKIIIFFQLAIIHKNFPTSPAHHSPYHLVNPPPGSSFFQVPAIANPAPIRAPITGFR